MARPSTATTTAIFAPGKRHDEADFLLVTTLVVSGCVYDPYAGGYYPAAAYAAPAYVPPMAYAPPTVVVVSPVYAPPVYGYGGPSVVIGGGWGCDAAGAGIVVGAAAGTVVAGVTDRTPVSGVRLASDGSLSGMP